MQVKTKEQLRELYGRPQGRAKIKVLNSLEYHSKNFIEHSPFFVMSTFDQNGRCDASPKGGKPGFVKILNDITLVFPDAKGNNRVDSLVNIVETEKIGCIFMIPGIDETLRINGTAQITTDPKLFELFADEQNPPKTCIQINIDEMFLHCAKAFMRSKLWQDDHKINRPGFPTMGKMLNDQLNTDKPEETQEEMKERYQKDL